MIKVEGYQNLYRDERSGAIVNTDSMAYNQYVNSLEQRQLLVMQLHKMICSLDSLTKRI